MPRGLTDPQVLKKAIDARRKRRARRRALLAPQLQLGQSLRGKLKISHTQLSLTPVLKPRLRLVIHTAQYWDLWVSEHLKRYGITARRRYRGRVIVEDPLDILAIFSALTRPTRHLREWVYTQVRCRSRDQRLLACLWALHEAHPDNWPRP